MRLALQRQEFFPIDPETTGSSAEVGGANGTEPEPNFEIEDYGRPAHERFFPNPLGAQRRDVPAAWLLVVKEVG